MKTSYTAALAAAKKIARREQKWQRVFRRAKYKIVAAILYDDVTRLEKMLSVKRRKWPLREYRQLLVWSLELIACMNISDETINNILTSKCLAVGIFILPLVCNCDGYPSCPGTVDD